MKKIMSSFTVIMLLFILVACGKDASNIENTNEENRAEAAETEVETDDINLSDNNDGINENDVNEGNTDNESSITVEKGSINNTITVPLDFVLLDEEDEDEVKEMLEKMEAEGAKDLSIDEEYVTFTISKSDHKKMMADMQNEVNASFEAITTDDNFPSIEQIKANKTYTKITITGSAEIYEESAFDGFAVYGIIISSAMYQSLNGVDPKEIEVVIEMIDKETKDIYETIRFPEDLEEFN